MIFRPAYIAGLFSAPKEPHKKIPVANVIIATGIFKESFLSLPRLLGCFGKKMVKSVFGRHRVD